MDVGKAWLIFPPTVRIFTMRELIKSSLLMGILAILLETFYLLPCHTVKCSYRISCIVPEPSASSAKVHPSESKHKHCIRTLRPFHHGIDWLPGKIWAEKGETSNSLWPVNQRLALNLWKAPSQRNVEIESAEDELGGNGIRHYKWGKQEKNATKMIINKLIN